MSSEISCYLTSAKSKACLPTCFKGDFYVMESEDYEVESGIEYKDNCVLLKNKLGFRGIYDLNILNELGITVESDGFYHKKLKFTCKIPNTNGPLYLLHKDVVHVIEPRFKINSQEE